ncbi:MAG: GIY-YIG nuclease family protein [Nitrososphaerota archaeon]|nr:GIY-YIG nuclease family protein [Candidatus Bathyarchaeota archaeon]MDW8049246.1 GIY-YIG nuclease family protein [Nitrososphaerota archaeon]
MDRAESQMLKEINEKSKMGPHAKGIYTLIIYISNDCSLKVGRLGERFFMRGYYAYTGSALGRGAFSLFGRLRRHMIKNKHMRWHIDHLLSHKDARIVSIVAVQTDQKIECDVNLRLFEMLHASIIVPKFGATDCKLKCRSHLIYLGLEKDQKRRLFQTYKDLFAEKAIIIELGNDL